MPDKVVPRRGRPPKPRHQLTRIGVNLDEERVRQLNELKQHIFGSNSVVLATLIATVHAQKKKEWPNDFN
jgi:hypothetical protein